MRLRWKRTTHDESCDTQARRGAAIALFVVTAVLAYFTWQNSKATKRLAEAQTEPSISISLQQRGRWADLLDLVIQNIGSGEAFDVKFEAKTDFTIKSTMPGYQKRFQDLNIIKNGLKQIAPSTLCLLFGACQRGRDRTRFEIKVRYKNRAGTLLPEKTYLIDFSTFIGIVLRSDPLEVIADNIGQLRYH
jgi:hypothetical protein